GATPPAPLAGPVVAVVAPPPLPPAQASPAARQALAFARQQMGQPYLWGGTGQGGYDCSGLVLAAYANAGIALPRVAQDQYDGTPKLAAGTPLLPGDLLFFGTSTSAITHVGMYVGGGLMVNAPYTGTVVQIDRDNWGGLVGATRPAP
ncbi:MAG: C40 family peptidase, partial [Acidimicrobiales bacterium]